MSIELGDLTSEVNVIEGELPLSTKQIDKLVQIVLARMEQRLQEQKQFSGATTIRRSVIPNTEIGQ